MKINKPVLAVILLLLGVLLGALGRGAISDLATTTVARGFVPTVKIAGDINEPFALSSFDGFVVETFTVDGESFKGIPLSSIIQNTTPHWHDNQILLIGDDGLSALLDGDNLAGCYISFSNINGWEAINLYHPISSNIKNLSEIVVISEDAPLGVGVNIITADQNLLNLTPGNLYKKLMPTIPRFEGASTLTHEGREFSASIYSRRRLFALADLLAAIPGERLMITGSRGEQLLKFDRSGYLELKGNRVGYLPVERGREIDTVKGIFVDPPAASITDLYYDSLHYLEQGERVLAIFIDGFGYHQYLHAIREGHAPYLSTLPLSDKALAVYPPITNVGFAAMITGKSPEENGVYARNQRQLKVPTIFAEATAMGKKAGLIKGGIQILDLEIEPVFNLDLNKNGTADDEIFETAREKLRENYDFLMLHFKHVDATGHSYGDLDAHTLEAISTMDSYLEKLVQEWDGLVIITCDHGMHSAESEGDHGLFRFEDMVVPYLIVRGGGKN